MKKFGAFLSVFALVCGAVVALLALLKHFGIEDDCDCCGDDDFDSDLDFYDQNDEISFDPSDEPDDDANAPTDADITPQEVK